MTKQEIINKLTELQQDKDYEVAHELADNLLLSFINDKDIIQAFQKIEKYYA